MRKAILLFGWAMISVGALSAAGCGDDTETDAPPCYDYAGFSAGAPVSFELDVMPIFQRSCGISDVCHGNPNTTAKDRPYLGPKSGTAASADQRAEVILQNVGVDSTKALGMKIVQPNNAQASFMMHKLDQNFECGGLVGCSGAQCGDPMPLNGPILADAERDIIRRWIQQGAQNN